MAKQEAKKQSTSGKAHLNPALLSALGGPRKNVPTDQAGNSSADPEEGGGDLEGQVADLEQRVSQLERLAAQMQQIAGQAQQGDGSLGA
jgi:hypothetical protein